MIEEWLLRKNKKQLQQVHNDKTPHVSREMKNIMGGHGVVSAVDDLLEGRIDSITASDSA